MRKFALSLAILSALALSASAQVVITEIHYHPVEEAAFNADGTPVIDLTHDVHEFIEIQNTNASAVNLGGWKLTGGIDYTFPSNTTIAAGGFRVIAKDPARIAVVYSLAVSNVLGPYSGQLGNDGDNVRVRDAADNVVDSVTYDSKFPWAGSADALGAQDKFTGLTSASYQYKGRSLQRVSVSWPASDPANWLASPLTGPTPGGPQAVTRAIPKPVVIAQSAAQTSDGAVIVRANNAATVNCTFSATTALSAVTLEYFVDLVDSTTETRTSVAMTDLGSGRYTASIPGKADRSIVRYRFKANRGDGLEVVSPRADDPQIAPIGASGAREAWHGYFVTPVRSSTNTSVYDVFVSTTALSTLSKNISQKPRRVTAASATGLPRDVPYVKATDPLWNGTQPGVFAYNGQVWDIQIRYHGSKYQRAAINQSPVRGPSFKVHFPDHQPLHGQSAWFETGHGSEFIEAQKLNRLLGLPASKMRLVDWYFNSLEGIVRSEQGDYSSEMLDEFHKLQQQLNPGSVLEENGELYKDQGNTGGNGAVNEVTQNNVEGPYTKGDEAPMLANAGWTQLQRYSWNFNLENHDWKGSTRIRDLIESMWTARGDWTSGSMNTNNVRAWFTNNFDMDTLLTSMALVEWMACWDDVGQNHYFWQRANGLWVRLGWDYDTVMESYQTNQGIYFGEVGGGGVFGPNYFKDTFFKAWRTNYNQRLWELNNSFFDPANLFALGFHDAVAFAPDRRTYINAQLASFGTYYKPNRPVNSYPTNGSSVITPTNLLTSAYSHPQSTAHASTRWEIRTASGDYEAPLLRVTSTNNKTALPIPFDKLTYGQTYYWRATHIDTDGHPSVVSAETSFTWGTASTAAGILVLNEILASNHKSVQNGTSFPDYIELRNNGSTNISLTGYALTDDPLNATKFVFPASTTIVPGGYVLVWCDKDTNAPGLHSGFELNADGETLLLVKGSSIVDSVSFGLQAPDVSIGRIVNGTGGWQANSPTPLSANSARILGDLSKLRVNEWMADPPYGEDWFEIFNSDTNVVSLAGVYLSDTPSLPMITQLPALSFIAGKGFIRFWADGSSAGGVHANFKLAKGGESLVLTAPNGVTTIDTFTFGAQTTDVSQGRLPDGGSTIVSFSSKTASPESPNWAPAPVYINELMSHTASPFEAAVELYNPTATNVDISGWWLSDDVMAPKKFQVTAGTIITPGAFKVFYAADLAAGAVPFVLGSKGGDTLLSAVDAGGNLTGFGSLVHFGPAQNNVSFGRVAATGLKATSGGAEFWPLVAHTFGQDNPPNVATFRTGTGALNAAPRIGPVTINEIMYHPRDLAGGVDDTQDEFIELYNVSGASVDMTGWRLRGDSDYLFPGNITLPADSFLLLVSFDPTNAATLAAFRATNNLSASTPIYGPYSGKLANNTHNLELASPGTFDGAPIDYLVDKVEYRDTAPWPTTADGGGKSLQRTNSLVIGNNAANWIGGTPTPGAVNAGVPVILTITTPSLLPGGVVGNAYSTAFTATNGTPPYNWVLTAGSVAGLSLANNGTFSGTPTTAGTNIVTVQVTDSATSPVTTNKNLTIIVQDTPLTITTTSPLPDGAVGQPYSQTLAANGGTSPYTWSLSTGTLPPGIILNGAGVLSGTPTASGTFTFTVRVADSGGLSAQSTLSVSMNNTPPTITAIADQTINEDSATGPLAFTIGDAESPASNLILTKGSSNPTLIPLNNVVFGGSGSSRTVTATPAANQNGSSTITVTVSDGQYSTSTSFIVSVTSINDPPSITSIPNQTTNVNATVGPLSFTIADLDTPLASLTLAGNSSNPVLVPVSNIVFGGSGSNRTVTVTPATDQSGSATISVTVNDGQSAASTSFLLIIANPFTGTKSFTNATSITIPDSGAGSPYPSTIDVTGMGGVISNMTVTVKNLSHTWAADIDLLLVGPSGQTIMLMSDAGAGNANNVTLVLSNGAAAALPSSALASGTFRPVNYTDSSPGGDNFPSPAPAGPYGAALTLFNGLDANGTWSLYSFDDGPGDLGSIAGGWVLSLTTVSLTGATPTITAIPDQSTTVNTPTAAIPFTIGDADTAVGSLTLDKASSNLTLVPTNNIVFGGSGSNRTVTVTPAANLTGTATITIGVSDGSHRASDTFVLTVSSGNTPPTITGIADQVIDEDTSTSALGFSIGDGETAPASLTLSKGSSNPTLVPTNNIVFGGSGASRTVTVTPAPNQNGAATITLTVSDGQLSTNTSFVVTVNAVNDAPTITAIANQAISVNGAAGPLSFTIGDIDTAVGSLTLSGDSSNTALVPTNNIVFGGSGASRTVSVTPIADQTGSSTITITVSDGQNSANTSFLLTVSSALVGTQSFSNSTSIGIPAIGAATPYPSAINVSGMGGVLSNMTLTLYNVAHQRMNDIDILLVGPAGQKVIVLSDVGPNGTQASVTLTLSDSASASLGTATLVSGTYKPTNITTGDTFPAPAPAGPYGTNLAAFNGQSPNGTWALYVTDDASGSTGSIAGGWSLTVTTVTVPPTITSIPNQVIPVNGTTGPLNFSIGDLDTPVASLTLSASSSNPTLVPTGNIAFGGSGSNRTVTVTPSSGQSGTATIGLTVSDGQYNTSTSFLVTVSTLSTVSFTNAAAITIPDSGAATPYPATINVSGMSGTISNMTITLRGVSHSWASDVDVLLVGPSGQAVMLMSDAGSGSANNVTLTLSDAATASLPASGLVSGTFRPTNLSDSSAGGDNFPSPAPAGPYGAALSLFNGQTANGIWSLYCYDDGPGDQGSIAGGWSMTLTTETGTAGASIAAPHFVAGETPPRITSMILNGHDISLTVSGEAGVTYLLESSNDLVNWSEVATLENQAGTMVFHDQLTTNATRFYRAVHARATSDR